MKLFTAFYIPLNISLIINRSFEKKSDRDETNDL